MKFYQVLVTNKFLGDDDLLYRGVYNYSTLAEALASLFREGAENKDVKDGELYDDSTGRTGSKFHLPRIEDGAPVLELCYKFYGIPEGCTKPQVICRRSALIREVIIEDK